MDPTEPLRRELIGELNEFPLERAALEAEQGQCWGTKGLTAEFTVHCFLAPFVSVTRKSDGKKGCMMFQHSPRFYFGFFAEE